MSASSSPLAAAKPRAGLGCSILFGLIFASAGLVAFWFISLSPALRAAASARWEATPCEILSSELVTHSDSDSSSYQVAIIYRYERDGRIHQSDRYDFTAGSTNIGVERMRAAVRDHPPGHRTVCYVDPADPDTAVLDRGIPHVVWFGSFTLLFPAVGALIIFFSWKNARKTRAEARSPFAEAAAGSIASPAAGDTVPVGEIVLKPSTGRLGAFIVMLCIAAFWNGIVSVFLVVAVKEFGRGFIGWFLPLFLIPFVLVGLALLAAAIQAFSRLFAPPVEVRLDPSRLRLGERVPFSWRLGGRGVRRLTIRLIAREEATYRQGTNTATDKSDAHREILFESTDLLSLADSRAEIVLPAEAAAPSLAAKNNKLVWELVFDGEIPWRADVNDRFTLPVLGPAHPSTPGGAALTPRAFEGEGLTLWTLDRFAPGETLVFTVARQADAAPGPITVQLGWFTEGRGTSDAAVVWTQPLPHLAPGTDHSFETRLPVVPWSFSGKLVSVSWLLEVLDAKGRPLASAPLVVAPSGGTVILPQLEAEPSSFQKRKERFLASRRR